MAITNSDSMDVLWPLLLKLRPRTQLGLSGGKPAVFYYPWFGPLTANSWAEVLRKALAENDYLFPDVPLEE